MLVWNVRGLNNPAMRSLVRLFMQSCEVSLVCFQESKLEVVDRTVVSQTLGADFDGFDAIPAIGTWGGILLARRSDRLHLSDI